MGKSEEVTIIDPWGRTHFLQSGHIEPIDVSSADFNPGKPFSILCGTSGVLKIVDTVKPDKKAIPIQEGYNPIILSKVIFDGGNTADDLWALF